MHAIERRPNHFRFQALTSTPTNFHPSLIRSKLPSKPKFRRKSARLDRGSAQLFPRAAVKNRIGAGRGASTLRLTSGRKQTESPHGAGNPPKRATSLLKFVKLYPPPTTFDYSFTIRFSIFFHPLFLSFEFDSWKKEMENDETYFSFFFGGKLKRNFVVGFVCLRNEECFENKWMECCF